LQERDLPDDVRVQAALGLEDVVGGVVPAELVLAELQIRGLGGGHAGVLLSRGAVGAARLVPWASKGYAHARNAGRARPAAAGHAGRPAPAGGPPPRRAAPVSRRGGVILVREARRSA